MDLGGMLILVGVALGIGTAGFLLALAAIIRRGF